MYGLTMIKDLNERAARTYVLAALRRTSAMRLRLAAFGILALLFSAGITQAQTYQIVSTTSSTVANNVTRTVTTVQVGSNPLNRFLMTRVRKDIPDHALKGTVLLLPPLASGFQNYEVGDGGDGFAQLFRKGCIIHRAYSLRMNNCAKPSSGRPTTE